MRCMHMMRAHPPAFHANHPAHPVAVALIGGPGHSLVHVHVGAQCDGHRDGVSGCRVYCWARMLRATQKCARFKSVGPASCGSSMHAVLATRMYAYNNQPYAGFSS